jgi:hypothetical protein
MACISAEAFAHLNLGGAEQIAKAKVAWYLDMVYPFLYGLAYAGIIWRLVSSRLGEDWHWLPILPFMAMAMDYAENVCLHQMFWAWPSESFRAATLTGAFFTPAKWLFAFVSTALMVGGLFGWVIRKVMIMVK